MIKVLILLLTTCSISNNCASQSIDTLLEQFSSKFEQVKHTRKINCNLELEWKVSKNGQPYFLASDSSRYTLAFYQNSSLPFYKFGESDFQICKTFQEYFSEYLKASEAITLNTIEENKEENYISFEIVNDFERQNLIVSSQANILRVFRIASSTVTNDEQIEMLKDLQKVNRD